MQSALRRAGGVAIALVGIAGAGSVPATAQWIITPPADGRPIAPRPPSEWTQPDASARNPNDPGNPKNHGSGDNEEDRAAQQPGPACPYNERKLELLV